MYSTSVLSAIDSVITVSILVPWIKLKISSSTFKLFGDEVAQQLKTETNV